MNYSLILGTRPEIIKLSGIIRFLESQNENFFIIHSNQHYSENLDSVFFKELGLTKPKYNLNIGSGNHGEQTAKMLLGIEKIFCVTTRQARQNMGMFFIYCISYCLMFFFLTNIATVR